MLIRNYFYKFYCKHFHSFMYNRFPIEDNVACLNCKFGVWIKEEMEIKNDIKNNNAEK